ncbi:coiled-coil domain-containing protein [Olsenella profusa]|uniref:Tat pathway signal protein n=1 Tax=Olsenella profusa TaxID=138595 RepID=A0ABS2F4Z1_9ACTN|nr:CHAP domain-containing protein [Olsenella profusa]MBM6775632.1 Tat pathway signal protein [Olsenella profusa]
MPRKHVSATDAGLTPRSVTRRDALRLLIGAGICATFFPSVALAETTQEKLDAAQLSYEQAQAELDRIGQEVAAAAAQLSDTQTQVSDLNDQISQKQDEIDQTQADIDQRQAEIEDKQQVLGERMSSAYKAGSGSMLDLILSSATIEELTSNIYYLDKASESDRAMIDEVRTLKDELEAKRGELEQQKADLESQRTELEALQAQQQSELEEVRSRQAESQELVDGLSADVQALVEQRDAELLAAQQAAEEARRQEQLAQQQQQQQNQGGGSGGGGSVGGGSTVVTGSGSLAAVVAAANSTPSPGSGLCAAWVTTVFQRAGIGTFYGNADDMYYAWCGTDPSAIQAGMIVATPSAPYSSAAVIYGHVGIYVGGGIVRHNQSGVVKSDSLSSWVSMYSVTVPVRCGWLGGVALS